MYMPCVSTLYNDMQCYAMSCRPNAMSCNVMPCRPNAMSYNSISCFSKACTVMLCNAMSFITGTISFGFDTWKLPK